MSASPFKPSTAYTRHNKVRLVRGGKEYFNTLKTMIAEAQHSVHLQVYIYSHDETGKDIGNALMAAAQRGVEVYMLLDGYASSDLPTAFITQLQAAGIQFRFFDPLLKSEYFYFGRRLHHKMVVTDARYSLVGGINISNKYNDVNSIPSWLDWALYAEGEISAELYKVCVDLWLKPVASMQKKKAFYSFKPAPPPDNNCLVRIRRNDWVKRKNQISRSYIRMLQQASSHVVIMSSYFLPGRMIRYNLSKASKRGVSISIIVTGVSDIKLAKHAERFMYRWLLKRNIRIYEYTPAVLHSKLATRDHAFTTIGSYNVNDISAYASIELNLDVNDPDFARQVHHRLEEIIASDCTEVTDEVYETKYHLVQRFFQYCSYMIVRTLYYLFTFYFKQQ